MRPWLAPRVEIGETLIWPPAVKLLIRAVVLIVRQIVLPWGRAGIDRKGVIRIPPLLPSGCPNEYKTVAKR